MPAIELSKEQYRNLIMLSAVANAVFGILGDAVEESDYKKQSQNMETLEAYLLEHAKAFDCSELKQVSDGKTHLDDEYLEKVCMPIINDYDEYVVHTELANRLAWRDFRREHSQEEIRQMEKKNGGYFGMELYDYEKKYWEEFDEHNFQRMEIQKLPVPPTDS